MDSAWKEKREFDYLPCDTKAKFTVIKEWHTLSVKLDFRSGRGLFLEDEATQCLGIIRTYQAPIKRWVCGLQCDVIMDVITQKAFRRS